ncbi:hypothetical protein PYCCODRAFT_1496601, partial [Trametes coccinea BRFM310]
PCWTRRALLLNVLIIRPLVSSRTRAHALPGPLGRLHRQSHWVRPLTRASIWLVMSPNSPGACREPDSMLGAVCLRRTLRTDFSALYVP